MFSLSQTHEWEETTRYEFEAAGAEHLILHWELPMKAMWALGDLAISSAGEVARTEESLILTATLTGSDTDRFAVRWAGNVAEGQLVQPTRVRVKFVIDSLTGSISRFDVDTLWPLRRGDDRNINCRGYNLAGESASAPGDLSVPDAVWARLQG